MYRKMLVLLDGSELAEVVFKYAQELSGRLAIDLELLHVSSPQEAEQLPMRRAYMEHMAQVLCARAEEIRTATDPDALGQCIQARGTVAVGDPAEEILRYVDENQIDLVMISTHGRSGFRGFDLGSVANKVVHASRAPVWLVPAELREEILSDTLPVRTLVIPLSGSKTSELAIEHGLNIAQQRGAESEIVLLHVHEVPSITYSLADINEREQRRLRMKEYLEKKAESIRQAGISARPVVLRGEPARTIIDYLRENPAQLIAMATRGNTGLSRVVFGSVAENVIHMIKKTPMLLVSGVVE